MHPEQGLIDKLLHAMLDGYLLADGTGRVLDVNRAYCEASGYTREELLGMRIPQLEAQLDETEIAERIARVMSRGGARFETKHVAKDGHTIDFEVSLCTLQQAGETRVAAFMRDITERKQTEEALRNNALLLSNIQPLAHLGIWQWYIDTNQVSWSDELYRIYGISRDDFGASFEGYLARVHEDDRERIAAEVKAALQRAGAFSFEERIVRPTGEVRSLKSWGGVVKNDAGRPIRMFGACLDVTETVRIQAALQSTNDELEARVEQRTAELAEAKERAEAADRTKSDFLATMSHELRTPLNSIIGFTGVLLKELAGPINAEQQKQLTMVRDSGQHLLALINDVLDLSKIEAQQLRLGREAFSLSASVEKVVEAQRLAAEANGLTLVGERPRAPLELYADKRRVEQILVNLISNAIKFTPKGRVDVTCEASGDLARVSVRDTGIGIVPEELPGLFTPFRQLDHGLSRRHEGTGLGLSISRHLARMHGGDIFVESAPGVGSTFTLELPMK